MARIAVLETHFVSGTSGVSERTQATPRADEFNLIAIDIALRYSEHRFVFANPQNLEPSGDDPDHLQQNYIMGFVLTDPDGKSSVTISDDWDDDFSAIFGMLDPADCVAESDMQIDNRYFRTSDSNE